MTKKELRERIEFAWNNPNCIWVFDKVNGYIYEEDGMTYATPGVAVMASCLVDISTDRGIRAWQLHTEWSYLLHMEQAINFLFQGNTHGYNDCVFRAGEQHLQVKAMFFKFNDISNVLNLLK